MGLSLLLPLPLPLSVEGAGSEGFPEPLDAFVSSAATVAAACDCWMALNNLTTVINIS